MDNEKVYNLLCSSDPHLVQIGWSILNDHEEYLIQKHYKYVPSDFNGTDKSAIFNQALKTFDENLKERKFEFIDEKSIEKFLYRLIEGGIKNEIRKRERRKKREELRDLLPEKSKTTPEISREEALKEVSKVIGKKIGKGCQQVLIDKHYWGESYQEIAEKTGISFGSARNKGSDCLKKLKEEILKDPKLGKYIKERLNWQ